MLINRIIVFFGLFRFGIEHVAMTSVHGHRYIVLRSMLKQARMQAGLTQVEMAHALGVGQSYVSKIERGDAYLDVMLFADWCAKCGLQPGDILAKCLEKNDYIGL